MRSKFVISLALVALALSACGSEPGNQGEKPSSTIIGSGSTFIQNYVQACSPKFASETGINVSYGGGGSGKGRTDIQNKVIDFAMSDTPFENPPADLIHIPLIAGPIAVMYRLDGYSGTLKLKRSTLAAIFAGKIKSWGDAALAADNPGLPKLPISIYYRQDSSGTSGVFTSYLNTVSKSVWSKAGNGDFKSAFPGSIPSDGSFQGASGSDGVSQGVATKNGAITYAELSYAVERKLKTADIENESGALISPSTEASAKFLANLQPDEKGVITANYANPDPASYNLTAYTYGLAIPGGKNSEKVAQFFNFLLTSCANQAGKLNYAPLEGNVLSRAQDLVGRL